MSESIPKMDMSDSATGCCPRFHPESWDGKEFNFDGLRFARVQTRSFLYMPVNMGSVMRRTQGAIAAAGAGFEDRYFMLSKEESLWKASHRLLVSKDVPGFENVSVSGTWFAKVFEGPFSQTGQWYREMQATMGGRGAPDAEILAFYTTCPKCAKAYGKNYAVLFGKLSL